MQAEDVQEVEVDFNPEFIQKLLPKINWTVLRGAASQLEALKELELPEALTDEMKEDNDLLKRVHHTLLEVEVIEGALVCPETGREFPVNKGIPNMLLTDDEV